MEAAIRAGFVMPETLIERVMEIKTRPVYTEDHARASKAWVNSRIRDNDLPGPG